eukprot:SAG31_NODE_490_length_14932_cov_9.350300_17_plen_180_part_00
MPSHTCHSILRYRVPVLNLVSVPEYLSTGSDPRAIDRRIGARIAQPRAAHVSDRTSTRQSLTCTKPRAHETHDETVGPAARARRHGRGGGPAECVLRIEHRLQSGPRECGREGHWQHGLRLGTGVRRSVLRTEELHALHLHGLPASCERCYLLGFCATIREIRDFNREKYGTNRESVAL